MTTLTWRLPAQLAVSGAEGWLPIERVVVRHLERDAVVSVESWPVLDETLDEFIAAHDVKLPEDRTWIEGDAETTWVMGRADGRRRRFTGTDAESNAAEVTVEYRLDPGKIFVVTSIVQNADDTLTAQADAIAASVAAATYLTPDSTPAPLPLRPGPAPDWTPVQAAWAEPRATPIEEAAPLRITFEEASAAAAQLGVGMLPGVDPRYLSSVDRTTAQVALRIGWRGLQARGVDEQGSILKDLLDLAAAHELLVSVTTRSSIGNETRWYAARPDRGVELRPDPVNGMVELRPFETGALVGILTGTLPDSEPAAEAVHTTAPALTALVRGSGAVAPELDPLAVGAVESVLVRTVFRVGSAIAGGEVEWLAGRDGLWRLERPDNASAITLTPTGRAALTDALRAVLPTANSREAQA